MKKKKRYIAFGLLASILALASCSGGGNSTPDTSSAGGSTSSGDSTSASSGDSTSTSGVIATLDLLQELILDTENGYGENTRWTSSSYAVLEEALANAYAVLYGEDPTQEEIQKAYDDLLAAIEGLIIVEDSLDSLHKALNADYSDSTIYCEVVTEGGEGESYYFYIYNKGGYTMVREAESTYSQYYHDYEGDSYTYFSSSVNGVTKNAWLNTGYDDVDLGLDHVYFDWSKALPSIDADKAVVSYGAYYFGDDAAYLEEAENILFSSTNLMLPSELSILDIGMDLYGENLHQIIGYYDEEGENYIRLTFSDIGSTMDIVSGAPEAPTSDNTMDYYSYYEIEKHIHQPVTELTLSHKDAAKDSYEPEETFSLYLDVTGAEGFSIDLDFDSYLLVENISDPSVIEVGWGRNDETRPNSRVLEIVALNEGTSTFSVSYPNEYGDKLTITSNTITVNVAKNTESAITDPKVYDFAFSTISEQMVEGQTLTAVNSLNNNKPFSITGDFLYLYDTAVSSGDNEDFSPSANIVAFDPSNQGTMNSGTTSLIAFDFGRQEVSALAIDLGLFWSSDYANIAYLSSFEIQTRASSEEEWSTVSDLLSTVKEKLARTHTTLIEASFAPTSQVRIYTDASMIGHSIRPAFENIRFHANSDCYDYTITEKIPLEGVALASSSYTLEVGESLTLSSVPTPSDATDVTYSYEVQDTSIAEINGDVLLAKNVGTTTITVTATQDEVSVSASSTLMVNKAFVALTGVSFPMDAVSYELDYDADYAIPEPIIEPADADEVTLSYSTSNTGVAIVDETGAVHTYGKGEATITVTATQGNLSFTDTILLTVTETLPTSVDPTLVGHYYGSYSDNKVIDVTINNDETLLLTYEGVTYSAVYLESTTKTSYDFYTDNYEVITISKAGEGIWLESSDLGITYDAYSDEALAPYVDPTSIELSETADRTLEVGQTWQLRATVSYGASIRTVTWTSSDSSIASVDENGLVTAVASGEATITATTVNGLTSSIKIIVATPSEPSGEDAVQADHRGAWYSYDYYTANDYYPLEIVMTIAEDGKSAIFEIVGYESYGYSSGTVNLTFVRSTEIQTGIQYAFVDESGNQFLFIVEASSATIVYDNGEYAFDLETANTMGTYLSQN